MAISLSFTAGGIILLYLLWNAHPTHDQTLNAVVFRAILGDSDTGHLILILTLAFEAGLLFVGANTGFLAGPSVLANMAVDSWMPSRFRNLSSRLVTQNGVLLFGLAALLILFWSKGKVGWLVVLYSINVFLTFSLSILGLCVYWWRQRKTETFKWRWRLSFSAFALCVTISILIITLFSKFTVGGWVTIVITSAVICLCLLVKKHYSKIARKLQNLDILLNVPSVANNLTPPALASNQPTAILLINKHYGVGMHTLLSIQRMFPEHFKNFLFLSAGVVDVESFSGKNTLESMQHDVDKKLDQFVSYCHKNNLAAKAYSVYGTDPAAQLTECAEKIAQEFPNCIFFATRLIFDHDNWMIRLLHNETATTLQRRLHARGLQLIILPIRIS